MTTESKTDVTGAPPVGCSAWLGRIVCGDNVEVLSGFPAECVDLVVTSPPYDDLRTYGGHSWDFAGVARELTRVLKPGGVIVWVVADATVNGSETGTSMRQALHFMDVCGLRLHDTMVYQKNGQGAVGSNRAYWQEWEYMFVLAKGAPKTVNRIEDREKVRVGKETVNSSRRNADGTMPESRRIITKETGVRCNVWKYDTGGEGCGHPAIFPDKLAKDHVASWSNPGDIVCDPFSGSGTTCKAAKELNRQWCGIEINPEYVKIAQQRLAQDVLQLEACHAP